MRNPWPMFCVLAATAALCMTCPTYALWLIVLAVVVGLIGWIVVPMKYDEWLAKKLNPYLLNYQQDHNFEKLEAGLNRWQPWAITKVSRNALLVNRFCALLEQERLEDARAVLEQIHKQATTVADQLNDHLLTAEYEKKVGDAALADRELRLAEELREKMNAKHSRPSGPPTARQSKRAFLLWLSFAAFLLIGGSVCAMVLPESILGDLGAEAVLVSFLALPVALVWLIVWMVRRHKENAALHQEESL